MMDYTGVDTKATGRRIRALRMEHKLTVAQICDYLGYVSEKSVYKWQRGDCLPSIDNMYALSALFNTPIDDILRGSRYEEDEKSSSR